MAAYRLDKDFLHANEICRWLFIGFDKEPSPTSKRENKKIKCF
jgi:hypothetical protein